MVFWPCHTDMVWFWHVLATACEKHTAGTSPQPEVDSEAMEKRKVPDLFGWVAYGNIDVPLWLSNMAMENPL